jgi:hypothetical protein
MQKILALFLSLLSLATVAGETVALPPAVEKSFRAQWKGFEAVSVKDKKDRFEVKAADEAKKEFKITFGTDGSVRSFSEHAIRFELLPAAVQKGAKAWAAQARWYPVQKAFKNEGDGAVYEMTGEINGSRFITRFGADGTNLNDTKNKDRGSKKSDGSLTRCC